jgi:hypothetical protein
MSGFDVRSGEANRWWQQNSIVGVLLNRLMLLFIFVPIALVFINRYSLSLIVFAFMIPYGFLVRYLAMRAVRFHLALHPDAAEEFESQGIIAS